MKKLIKTGFPPFFCESAVGAAIYKLKTKGFDEVPKQPVAPIRAFSHLSCRDGSGASVPPGRDKTG
jgi:hypothetical protein